MCREHDAFIMCLYMDDLYDLGLVKTTSRPNKGRRASSSAAEERSRLSVQVLAVAARGQWASGVELELEEALKMGPVSLLRGLLVSCKMMERIPCTERKKNKNKKEAGQEGEIVIESETNHGRKRALEKKKKRDKRKPIKNVIVGDYSCCRFPAWRETR
ncbi:uncharacterized protein TrAtP1_001293 [Trichoderma atroviride]|uniref:uncharacterized protein n=1 Tax=Hypocrea atroviridis TaxID=63577 RepID=UPI00332E2C62|nr:hypothetical protein TrAtP1_001293 [Trichoderma atroviride]